MPFYVKLASLFPSIAQPEKRLTLKEKLKWTVMVLVLFYAMGSVFIYGIEPARLPELAFYEIIFGSRIGSIITLGIGPIVMASIVLQMLVGSKLLPWDLRREEDRIKYNAAQKLLIIFFCFFEAITYALGFVRPVSPELFPIVVLQMVLGGIIIMYLDELTTKWGIGSGVSLFIAAGVSKRIIMGIFLPQLEVAGRTVAGVLFSFFKYFFAGDLWSSLFALLPLISTLLVFAVVIFAQGIRVEIPISFSFAFGRLPARKWPLRFLYTSNIPVILAVALLNSLTLFARVLYEKGIKWLGVFNEEGHAVGGLIYYLSPPRDMTLAFCIILSLVVGFSLGLFVLKKYKKYGFRATILGGIAGFLIGYAVLLLNQQNIPYPIFGFNELFRAFTYMIALGILSTIFSVFWVITAGMDPKSVAEQFKSAYLSIPGFRRDPRVIERLLEKYIPPLAVLGGLFVGLLAGVANLTEALGTGTGILLTAIIVLQFYESIMMQHLEDIHPAIRNFIGR